MRDRSPSPPAPPIAQERLPPLGDEEWVQGWWISCTPQEACADKRQEARVNLAQLNPKRALGPVKAGALPLPWRTALAQVLLGGVGDEVVIHQQRGFFVRERPEPLQGWIATWPLAERAAAQAALAEWTIQPAPQLSTSCPDLLRIDGPGGGATPELEAALRALRPGAADLVQSRMGWHVIAREREAEGEPGPAASP